MNLSGKKTLLERGLDFSRANEIFQGTYRTNEDTSFEYEEERYQTASWLDKRIVIVVWAQRKGFVE